MGYDRDLQIEEIKGKNILMWKDAEKRKIHTNKLGLLNARSSCHIDSPRCSLSILNKHIVGMDSLSPQKHILPVQRSHFDNPSAILTSMHIPSCFIDQPALFVRSQCCNINVGFRNTHYVQHR